MRVRVLLVDIFRDYPERTTPFPEAGQFQYRNEHRDVAGKSIEQDWKESR